MTACQILLLKAFLGLPDHVDCIQLKGKDSVFHFAICGSNWLYSGRINTIFVKKGMVPVWFLKMVCRVGQRVFLLEGIAYVLQVTNFSCFLSGWSVFGFFFFLCTNVLKFLTAFGLIRKHSEVLTLSAICYGRTKLGNGVELTDTVLLFLVVPFEVLYYSWNFNLNCLIFTWDTILILKDSKALFFK